MKKWISVLMLLSMVVGLVGCGEKTEEPAPAVDPNAIAQVMTGSQSRYVYDVEEMIGAIDPSGHTEITLLKDISYDKTLQLPYSCAIDFAGHTLQTNPERGIGIQVETKGEQKAVTLLTGGSLNSYGDCVRVNEGAIQIVNMNLHVDFGSCVTLYEANKEYKEMNRIEGSTLASANGSCLSWNENEKDYSETGIAVVNTSLIAYGQEGAQIFKKASNAKAGMIDLQEGVTLYSYADVLAKDLLFRGSGMAKTTGAEVTVNGSTITGLNKWEKDTENKVVDVLMIGNSFCYYFTEELYGMAASEGFQLNITNLYYGGRSVKAHWNRLEDGKEDYDYWVTNELGRYKYTPVKSIQGALAYGDWDVITLQQHFSVERTLDYATALESCTPYAKNIYDYLKTNYPNADLYWQQTWAYQVGYPTNDNGMMPVDSTAVQTRQHTQIRDVSITLCQENNVGRIPSGGAWQIARGVLGDGLCKADCCHDGDTGGGQYLNACVWYEVLTGKSCIGNLWRPDYKLSEDKIATLQQAAHEAVAEVYGEDYAK